MINHAEEQAEMSKKNQRRLIALACLVATVLAAGALFMLFTRSPSHPHATLAPRTCPQKLALVQYRTELLSIYKKAEKNKYDTFRYKWATRITYASQWVPGDAEKTRADLYKYDTLHAATLKEINKQLQDDAYHKDHKDSTYQAVMSLDCSSAKAAALDRQLTLVDGRQNKKIVGGNALIARNKQQETKFLNQEFKQSSQSLLKKLHQAKAEHVKPQSSTRLQVRHA